MRYLPISCIDSERPLALLVALQPSKHKEKDLAIAIQRAPKDYTRKLYTKLLTRKASPRCFIDCAAPHEEDGQYQSIDNAEGIKRNVTSRPYSSN
jgi:hypothetical protein